MLLEILSERFSLDLFTIIGETLWFDDLWTSHQRKISTENQIKRIFEHQSFEQEKNLATSARNRNVIGVLALSSSFLCCKQINI